MPALIDAKKLTALERKYDGLIANQESSDKWTMTALARYVNNPVGFQRDVLKFEPWTRQEDIAQSVLTNAQTAVRGCNGAGKDREAAALLLWWVYTRPGALGLVTGPTQRQVDEIVFAREIAGLWRRAKLPGILLAHALRLPGTEIADDGTIAYGILGFVSTDQSKLTGHHAPNVMTVITEAQGVRDNAIDAMFNNATGENDRMLMVANPTEPSGRFFRASQPKSGWNSIRMPAREHPNIVQKRTVIPGGPTIQWLERVGREWGKDSREWRIFVEAEFPDSATDALVTRQHVEAANLRFELGQWTPDQHNVEPVVGLDVAREGGDLCVAAPMRGPVVYPLVRWAPDSQDATGDTIVRAEEVMRKYGGRPSGEKSLDPLAKEQVARGIFVIDQALMGGGVVDGLRARGWKVIDWNGARSVKEFAQEPERWENMRALGYFELRDAFVGSKIFLSPDTDLAEALYATRYTTTPRNKNMIVRKPVIRSLLGRSPDDADAVMMGWFGSNVGTGAGGSVLTM